MGKTVLYARGGLYKMLDPELDYLAGIGKVLRT